jgi:F0F1-type ATP synthase membrane subunit b/b'
LNIGNLAVEEHHFDILNSVLIPYINFFIFVGLFVFFFRKPLAALVRGRRHDFEKSLAAASSAKDHAEKVYNETKARFDRLDEELKQFSDNSLSLASREADRQLEDGRRLVEQIRKETEQLSKDLVVNAKQQLREEMLRTAATIVEERLRNELKEDKQHQLIQKSIGNLKSVKG